MRGGDAVCVETRNHPRLRAAVETVRALLPTAWHITILHGPQNAAHARRELASIPDVRLRALPGDLHEACLFLQSLGNVNDLYGDRPRPGSRPP